MANDLKASILAEAAEIAMHHPSKDAQAFACAVSDFLTAPVATEQAQAVAEALGLDGEKASLGWILAAIEDLKAAVHDAEEGNLPAGGRIDRAIEACEDHERAGLQGAMAWPEYAAKRSTLEAEYQSALTELSIRAARAHLAASPEAAPAAMEGVATKRPCYMCGRPDTEHPWQPRRGGGMERGPCPATQQRASIGAATPAAPGAATHERKALIAAHNAIEGLIAWDARRDYPVPYKVRDPLHEALNLARAALAQPAPVQQPAQASEAVSQSITIDFRQATELLEMFGGEPCEITLTSYPEDDHHFEEGFTVAAGLYAHYTDCPEEGSAYLGVTDEDAAPVQQDAPAPSMVGDAKGGA